MKFSIGYRADANEAFLSKIIEYRDSISEVYFSWSDIPNGRNSVICSDTLTPWEAQAKEIADLKTLSDAGLSFGLLFNATCYGRYSQSRAFFNKLGDAVEYVAANFGLRSVTTASPLVASFVRRNFPKIDVRASVNMCIGTEEGFEYVADCFDSFYLKRELNRDFGAIERLRSWCSANGKALYALANSGCLNNCSAHTFHDNLVSHEAEISEMDNGFSFECVAKKYFKEFRHISKIAGVTGFIRPEDIHLYEGIFASVKLATRVNSDPVRVLDAYIGNKRYSGSVFALLEPDHTAALYPYFLENSRIESTIEDGRLIYNTDKALLKLSEDIYADQ